MKRSTTLSFILILLLAAACAINPVTGRRELALISEQGEIEMGKETDAGIAQEYGYYGDAELTRYVASVGMAIVPHTHRPNLEYHFAVLDTPVVNAFAAPGGYVYVTRGILALMNSESELAAVLGHELGHVSARHSVRMLSKQILVTVGLAVGSVLSEKFAKIAGVAGIGAQLLFLKFSRDDEREADALGVQYARSTLYNAGEMVNFFAALQRYGDMAGGGSLPGFLSTHPLTSERIQNVKALLGENDVAFPVKRDEYLNRINDIIYGDDPRQGFVEGSAFYHPAMGFVFAVPSGWEVQNTPVNVTMAEKNGNAAIVLQAETTKDDLAVYAKQKGAKIQGGQILNEQPGWVNGLAAYHQTCNIVQEGQDSMRARLSFIRKNGTVYTLTQVSKALDFNRYDPAFQSVVSSFNELKDSRYLSRQPQHIKVLRADGQRRYKDFLGSTSVNKETLNYLAIMNELKDADTVPERNRLIKIIR
jgi:predicted Zn-dependent protease